MKRHLLAFALCFLSVVMYGQTNLKSTIRGANGTSRHYTAIASNNTISFQAASAKKLLGLDDNADLILTKTEPDKLGYIHYRYFQTYKGIPVENSMYIAHTRNNLLKGMTGSIITDFDPAAVRKSNAGIAANRAVDIAVAAAGAQVYAWNDAAMEQSLKIQTHDKNASYAPKAQLVWYSPGGVLNPRQLKLSYKVDVYAIKPLSRVAYYVDAATGKVNR